MAVSEKSTDGLEVPEYHDLQLTKHDATTGLPELDTAANAPERDNTATADGLEPIVNNVRNCPHRDGSTTY